MFRRLENSQNFWIGLTLFALAFAIRFALAQQLIFPQLDDPASYIQVARHIAQGRGLVSDVIWNFWVPFDSLTHPSNEFWMPLSSWSMALSIRLWGDSLLAAQLPGILFGSLLAPMMYLVGQYLWPDQRRWNILAAILIVPNAVAVYQSVSADSSALYTLLSSLTLVAAAMMFEKRQGRTALVCGVLCGLSYLSRSHGTLLLAAIIVLGLLTLPRYGRAALKLIGIVVISYLVVVFPWWIRNQVAFGAAQPIPLTTIAASWEYADWYNYTDQPALANMLAAGWQPNVDLRVDALLKDLSVILTMTFPFGLIGLPVVFLRRELFFRLFTVYALILFFGISLILPSSGPGGALYHSAGSFIVWAAWGSVILVRRLFEKQGTRRLAVVIYGVILGLGVGQLALTWPKAVEQSRIQGQQFATIAHWLRQNVPPDEPVLTTQANSLNYASGYPTISIPLKQGADTLRQIAHRYQSRFVVITERNQLYPDVLNHSAAGFELIAQLPDTAIYRLRP